jgi:dihydrofolate reductase
VGGDVSRIVAFESVTLDGVMQAPGRPDEDRRGGFEHGGWATPYADPMMWEHMSSGGSGALLFGRRTYEDFFAVWPGQSDNPFTPVLNATLKHVASRTLTDPLLWEHSHLLDGDAVDAVAGLREQPGDDIVILGSGVLVRSLLPHGLIDQVVLLIHPLALGTGQRLFDEGVPTTPFRLVDSKATPTGVLIATYEPEDASAEA